MLRAYRAAICTFASMLLVACSTSVTPPATTTPPVAQTPLPTTTKTEPVSASTATAAVIGPESPISGDAGELLKSAVANLQNATSFRMAAHVVRAYRVIAPSGATHMVVYGEFNTNYAVIRLPTLKVHANYEHRYDPQDDFVRSESYTYQENGKYFIRFVEASAASYVEEIDLQHIEPIAGDVYQTLVTYSDQAEFVTESDGVAVYILNHPEWTRLEGAVGFADLGFLRAQENGEQLVKQYAAEHYPNVKTIRFTIYVATNEQVITRVVVDDRDFMASVWAEVDRALTEHGEKPENLTRYEVMSANGAEYVFSDYNQVQDSAIPQVSQETVHQSGQFQASHSRLSRRGSVYLRDDGFSPGAYQKRPASAILSEYLAEWLTCRRFWRDEVRRNHFLANGRRIPAPKAVRWIRC
jgi:hypothetical protein